MLEIREGLCFDDVLLVPQHSEVKSRSTVDLSIETKKKGFSSTFKHPVIPANMKTVMGFDMAKEIWLSGGLGLMHRFCPVKDQLDMLLRLEESFGRMIWNHLGLSVGVQPTDKEHIKYFVDNGVEILCVDVAHGDSDQCIRMTEWISQQYPEVLLIAGNVATGNAAERLWSAGADIVKVGVGPGSLCTTRIETGNGVPQLTALIEIAAKKEELVNYKFVKRPIHIIADGGIKNAGDVVKALCFADMVMIGNLFAGCVEAPGDIHTLHGIPHKEYLGSSTHKTNHIEGVAAWVPCTGRYENVLTKLLEGLRSGMSYQNANNLTELKENPEFIRITGAGLAESHPHSVINANNLTELKENPEFIRITGAGLAESHPHSVIVK
jgi:IMP dehydrogenase